MSMPKLVVLGFLSRQQMYGYQIGQIVENFGLPVWARIRLPSIYKALQELESSNYIRGEQEVEGNNPPRKVFHLNAKGRDLHARLVHEYITSPQTSPQDWWLVLSFAQGTMEQSTLEAVVETRIKNMTNLKDIRAGGIAELIKKGELPFVYKHLANLGKRHHDVDICTLKELLKDIQSGLHSDFFVNKGD